MYSCCASAPCCPSTSPSACASSTTTTPRRLSTIASTTNSWSHFATRIWWVRDRERECLLSKGTVIWGARPERVLKVEAVSGKTQFPCVLAYSLRNQFCGQKRQRERENKSDQIVYRLYRLCSHFIWVLELLTYEVVCCRNSGNGDPMWGLLWNFIAVENRMNRRLALSWRISVFSEEVLSTFHSYWHDKRWPFVGQNTRSKRSTKRLIYLIYGWLGYRLIYMKLTGTKNSNHQKTEKCQKIKSPSIFRAQ